MVKLIFRVGLLALLLTGGCQDLTRNRGELDDSQREYILSKVNNYNGLIKLYREKLSQKEDKYTRYQLAEYYYMAEDFDSSRQYLQPLLSRNPDERVLILESKNLMDLGQQEQAQLVINRVVVQNPENGEAWNLQGVLLAQHGDYSGARRAFNQARQRFVDDNIVINNLAMLAIIQEEYATARDYLLSLYTRGQASQKVQHNLVYVLVKLNDFNGAESILRQEKLAEHDSGLIEALVKINPRKQQAAVRQLTSVPDIPITKPGAQGNTVAVLAQNREGAPPKTALTAKKKTVQPEIASLVATEDHLKEIFAVRSGQHSGYLRLTLESRQAINFRELPCDDTKKRIFELHNVRLGDNLLRAADDISRRHHNINKLKFYQNQAGSVLVEFDFSRPLIKSKTFRIDADKRNGERLVFDIFHS